MVARVLWEEGCRRFFVADLHEASTLQEVLPDGARIFVLNGIAPGAESFAATRGILPVLSSLEQIDAWSEACAAQARRLPAAIQVDTGMTRLGLSQREVDYLLSRPDWSHRIEPVLLMSHLACADEPAHAANAEQLSRFLVYASLLGGTELSFANSGGVFLGTAFHGDCVRAGVALYGVNPSSSIRNPMTPVVQIDARVIQLREVPAGTGVGYGLSHVTAGQRTLATVGVGYADGWPRSLGGKGAVYFNGNRLPIVGRVSMDSMVIDVSEIPRGDIRPGSFVELVGPHQSLEDVARDAGTIAYELLTLLGDRYARSYVDDADV